MRDAPVPPIRAPKPVSPTQVGFVGMTPPRPGPTGYTRAIPKITIPTDLRIPPLLPKEPLAWRPQRRFG